MKLLLSLSTVSAATLVVALLVSLAHAQAVRIDGAPCVSPPSLHCPDADCSNELLANRGNAVLPKSNRAFFLEYPCNLKPGEPVTFILSLHGAGVYGNWHRHYFPLVDLKDKYRLVIATPTAVKALWSPDNDDRHLRQVVDFVYQQIGAKNIKAFWLAGHSDGSQAAYRLLKTDFYRDRLTGWVSLSGGRLGSPRAYSARDPKELYLLQSPPDANPAATVEPRGGRAIGVGLTDATVLPEYSFSHIYSSGEHELTVTGLPDHSRWAQKLACKAQTRRPDVVDTKAGYVWNSRSPLTLRGPTGGRRPRPGRAQVYLYPDCPDGRIVADVIRLDKGHTEGLEPNVTQRIVSLMLSAK